MRRQHTKKNLFLNLVLSKLRRFERTDRELGVLLLTFQFLVIFYGPTVLWSLVVM